MWGWRSAYLFPGLAAIALGLLLTVELLRGNVPDDRPTTATPTPTKVDATEPRRPLIALAVAMLCGSLLYAAFTTALPKWTEIRIQEAWPQANLSIVGIAVSAVFLVGGLGQVLAGHLADRHDPREVYLYTLAIKPFLMISAVLVTGPVGLVLAALLILAMDVTSPSESLLLARWAPVGRRGLAFGVRHALALAATPAGVWLAAVSHGTEWGLDGLFLGLAGLAVAATFAAAALPHAAQPARKVLTASSRRNR